MKKTIIIAALCAASLLTACREKKEMTFKETVFDISARTTIEQALRDLTGTRRITVLEMELTDTCYQTPTRYTDKTLAKLESMCDALYRDVDDFSEEALAKRIELTQQLEQKISDYKLENRTNWGYRARVIYRNRRQTDTLCCEISKSGLTVRALVEGADDPLRILEEY